MKTEPSTRRAIPSVDEVLKTGAAIDAIDRFGRPVVVAAIRKALEALRTRWRDGHTVTASAANIAADALAMVESDTRANVRPVFNLTGTILHTNLGRAVLAEQALDAAVTAMRQAIALEFDLENGKRGERDSLIKTILCELTGAEDATLVNNNAAAILLVLNTFARRREAIVSRGELIEIGGAFRLPEIMARAGARLVEIGTTNRTHAKDYIEGINAKTGLVLKVHTSNYRIEGFTKEVGGRQLAEITGARGVPLAHDLGSGTLIDLSRYGLTHEPTVAEAVADGADLVTFSGDKLLGGPQAGFIVGRKDLIARINRNSMKRALRVDKIRLAAIEATLRLYSDPERLAERVPTIRQIAYTQSEITERAGRILPIVSDALGAKFLAKVEACKSQVGSGALPQETIASSCIAIRSAKKSGRALSALAAALRQLPIPVIGRIADQSLILDLRCLEDEAAFAQTISAMAVHEPAAGQSSTENTS